MRLLFLIILLSPLTIKSQKCDCQTDFDYLRQQVEKNYAGFIDKTATHQFDKYKIITSEIEQKVKNIKDKIDCATLLNNWLNFFNDRHLYLVDIEEEKAKQAKRPTQTPYFKLLDKDNVLLTIPSFNIRYKSAIDSIVVANHSLITSTNNFIIDIRGNGGGQDFSFKKILPYIYTNPIVQYSTEVWASEDNINHFKKDLQDSSLSDNDKKRLKDFIKKAENNKNTFVNRCGQDTFHITFDTIYNYPKNVAILVDGKCASSAEEFLLYSVQSKKVIIFGKNTSGTLDYSNIIAVWLPSGKRVFALPLTRSMRLPINPIDKDGIKPNIIIVDSINNKIKFIQQYLKK
jgi:C-terminal processing protease CtpA/Prc